MSLTREPKFAFGLHQGCRGFAEGSSLAGRLRAAPAGCWLRASTRRLVRLAMSESIVPLPAEEAPLQQMKAALQEELATEPWCNFPELVGDIRLLRFLRGHGTAAAATSAFKAHLAWRKEFGVDAIRDAVVDKKMELNWDHYPRGSEIFRFFPMQINGGTHSAEQCH